MASNQYRDRHDKSRTVSRPSYLYNANPHSWRDGLHIETGHKLRQVDLRYHVMVLLVTGLTHWDLEKWPQCCTRQKHFRAIKCSHVCSNSTAVCWECLNIQQFFIGSDNGLVTNRRHGLTTTNSGKVYWHTYASLGLDELKLLIDGKNETLFHI